MAIQIPKLKVPFEITGARAGVVEQDSTDEVAQCVFAVLATDYGQRLEEPEFGIAEQAFRKEGADLDELREAVEEWEPRADILTEDELENVIQRLRVEVA